jgi:predicted acyltransferase
VLFAIGLGLNLFPEFDLATLRIPGVLQRIAVVYLACVTVYLAAGPRGGLALAAGLLAGYAALLAWAPVPGAGGSSIAAETNLPVWLDEMVLGRHTWRGPGDPEGILSTLPAIATGLVGMLAGERLRTGRDRVRTAQLLAAAGVACLAAGWIGGCWLPVAKEIWTSSYALVTAGWALLALALGHRLVDGPGRRRALEPAVALGRNALLAYVAAHLLSDLGIRVLRWPDGAGGSISLHHWIQRHLLASWLPPEAASLAQSLLLLAVILLPLLWLHRRGIVIKI